MHALDGFEVEAVIEHGKPRAARVLAAREGCLRLLNTSSAIMTVISAERRLEVKPDEMFEVAAQAGSLFEFEWEMIPLADSSPLVLQQQAVAASRPDVIYPGYKIRPPHTSCSEGHWHDERSGNAQVGLAADGLFPVTRAQQETHQMETHPVATHS